MTDRKLTVMLADDDDGHAMLIQRNLVRAGLNANVIRMRTGVEVVSFFGRRRVDTIHQPLVVLLDINMPEMDGIEVLRRLKSDPASRSVPIYMLTTTDDPQEVARCFALGCNAYLSKPVEYSAFSTSVERLCQFLAVSQIPGPELRKEGAGA